MKARNGAVIVALMMFAPAVGKAGNKFDYGSLTLTSTYFWGQMGSVRASSSKVESLACEIESTTTAVGYWAGDCYATNAAGTTVMCSFNNQQVWTLVSSLHSYDWLEVFFTNGVCTYVYKGSSSNQLPMQP